MPQDVVRAVNPRCRRGLRLALLLGGTALAVLPGARAEAADWTGATSTDWNTTTNWSTGAVPTAADNVFIYADPNNPSIDALAATTNNTFISNGGALSIVNGGSLSASGGVDLGVGGAVSSSILLNTGSTLLATTLSVGDLSQGVLTITGGAGASSVVGTIGNSAWGVGAATVLGAGSTWTISNTLSVGYQGQGSLFVYDGGAVTATANVQIGDQATGVGEVSVEGPGSFLSASYVGVGGTGHGTLNVASGGNVASTNAHIGINTGAVGAVFIAGAGSAWSITDDLGVGAAGQGSVLIENGGSLGVGSAIYIGGLAAGVGTVTVDGSGSSLNATAMLGVGYAGQGTLNVTNGGNATTLDGIIGGNPGSSGSATIDGAGSTWTVTGFLSVGQSGSGTLTVQNAGAVNANDMAVGNNAGSVGAVTIAGAGSALNVGAALVVGWDGSGTLTIANGGAVTAAAVTIASGASGTGALNIGSGGAAGTLNAASVQFGNGTGTLNFNHTETNYTFAPDISGNGTINHLAGVTTLTGNSSSFTGTTNVSGGSLYLNGSLGGTLDVTGGLFGGSGTAGAVTVSSGGTVAPGNSVGTINVATMTFNAGSTYNVELNDGGNTPGVNNDHINATGAVTINGGTVHVTPENGTDTGQTYTAGTVYTVITAAGGVTGAFTALTDDYAYLNFTASYDANNVYLTSQLAATTFCLPGMTANQCATGNGVFSLGAGQLYTAVLNLSAAEAPGALNQLSGEIHASAKTALIEDSRFVREAAVNRIRSAFEGVAAGSMPTFAYASAGPQPAPASTDGFALWGQAFGAFGHVNGDGNAARLGRSSGGLFIGGDGHVGDHWRVGALGGYSHSKFDVDALASSGSSKNYHAGVYGGGEWGAFGLRFGGAYSWHDIDIARSVAFTGFSDRLASGYRAGTAQVFGELGYRVAANGVRYEPFVNAAYVNLHTNGFSETGGAAALAASGQTTDTAFTTLGLRADTALAAGSATQATLRGMLGWRHAYGDVVPASVMTFVAGGSAFTVAGVPIAEDAFVLDAGVDVKLTPSAVLGIAYGGQFGSGVTDQSVKANFAVKF